MKLRRYCVTVLDTWTPTREFWTLRGALAHRNRHLPYSYLWRWSPVSNTWVQLGHHRDKNVSAEAVEATIVVTEHYDEPVSGQLFVVVNDKKDGGGGVYVFDNHDAAMKCRIDLKLTSASLCGQGVSGDWVDGHPVRRVDMLEK